ncbi:hypothetical protein QFC20_006349 [Naganishia adeliensis]|uniref:Uncharacterized protein n=1 Tax=Naganishia adeliensis TaxID=92952 RepID=A0ACC2VBX4_9TREE|nr:hypothetical protein QFC20_006349 [Naganishia adeliensis]
MKFSLIAIAATAAIFGKASPVPQGFVPPPGGGPCPAGLKVFGCSRIEGFSIRGEDYASVRAQGKYDNFGGPVLAGALIRSGSLPGQSEVFIQSKNANYFYHKKGGGALKFLYPDPGYDLYFQGS